MKILFTKKGCEKCDFVKENLPADHDIKIIDAETTGGLATLSWLALTSAAQTLLPIYVEYIPKDNELLPEINKTLTGAINIKNYLNQAHAAP